MPRLRAAVHVQKALLLIKVQFLVQGFLPQFNRYCHLKHRVAPPPASRGILLVALFSPWLVQTKFSFFCTYYHKFSYIRHKINKI